MSRAAHSLPSIIQCVNSINVLTNVSLSVQEIFGPVQSIIKFKTLDEVIKRANETK